MREDNAWLNKTVVYEYDNGGNIQLVEEYTLTSGALDGLTATDSYAYLYGDSNWRDKLTSYDGSSITYDEIGNPLDYYNGLEFEWRNGRQLASVTGIGLTASYKYNANGIRTQKTVNGVTTVYTLDGICVLKESDDTNTFWYYYDPVGAPISFELNNIPYFYITNYHGDVVAITDENGTIVVEYAYDSWGKLISITGSLASTVGAKNPYRYRGYYYDTETGLYYLQSRYYDPEMKRFVNADGYASTGQGLLGSNAFAYCGNNPVNRADPSGQFWGIVLGVVLVVCIVASLSGCSSKSAPTSDVGAATPYVDMPGSDDPNSPNCYAYAIGSSVNEQPGEASGQKPKSYNNVYDVGKSVEADLKAKGKSVRVISGPDALVYDNEYKIALRVGTQPFAYNSITGELYYDYHFMRQTSTGQWAEKHGTGGSSILWDAGMTPDSIPWTLGDTLYYDSDIIYYAIGN